MNEVVQLIDRRAPKWVIMTLLVVSGSLNCFLGATTVTLIVERVRLIERDRRDEVLSKYAELSERTAKNEAQLAIHDKLIDEMVKMRSEISDMNIRLKRKGI